jgi:hypothetical protein
LIAFGLRLQRYAQFLDCAIVKGIFFGEWVNFGEFLK